MPILGPNFLKVGNYPPPPNTTIQRVVLYNDIVEFITSPVPGITAIEFVAQMIILSNNMSFSLSHHVRLNDIP